MRNNANAWDWSKAHAKHEALFPIYYHCGIEGRVPHKGKLSNFVYQLVGGIRSAMGYCGTPDIESLRNDVQFVRMSSKGRKTMKLCIQTFTTLLIIVVILLTGCNGDQQKPPEQVEPQADTQKDVTTFPEADADTTLPTTFYPPENPYEYLTVTGTAPTSDYIYKTGAEYLWIPEFDYEWEIGEIPQVTLPVAPNHAWKWARYEQREKEFGINSRKEWKA